jgi:hypothetical protein
MLYKIRNKETGLFSTGGISPNWTKLGKTWNSIGTFKSHLTLVGDRYNCIYNNKLKGLSIDTDIYKNCEVVEVEFKECKVSNIKDFIEENTKKKVKESEKQIICSNCGKELGKYESKFELEDGSMLDNECFMKLAKETLGAINIKF